LKNRNGSTALHLAVQNTGRGASGEAASQEQQEEIIAVLLEHGARLEDTDSKGKTVSQSATSQRVRTFLTSL
jgi:ankyrin repeat protein